MSVKGLPATIKMRHDSHYVDEFAKTNRSIGRKIPIHLIEPNPEQPRTEIGDLTELSGSIKEKGVLEPILVKPNPKSGTWMIIAGERRWRAANLAGLTEMPCVELDIDEKDIAEIALIENLQRKDLTIWEEVDGYAYLIEKFNYTHEQIAKKIGKSRTTITEALTVAGLPENIRAKCRNAGIAAKSSLLEIARQFDETAMHEYLSNFGTTSIKREKTTREPPAKKHSDKNLNKIAKSETEVKPNHTNPNVFRFASSSEDFNLEIVFLKNKTYDKSHILQALKEAYASIKS